MNLPARRYAVRRLSPFLGVMQVVELGGGRALSVDGANWEIQLAAERSAERGGPVRGGGTRRFYRYAMWSAREGLAHCPVHILRHGLWSAEEPLAQDATRLGRDARAVWQTGEALVAAVQDSRLPFAPADCYEHWLLDASDATPVALLASVTARDRVSAQHDASWSAAQGGETGFESAACAGDALRAFEERVRDRCGARTRWFERRGDGSGVALAAPDLPAELPADAFPELALTERWPHARDAALARDYLDWLAPRLLTLPLAGATRARLERAAAARAALVEHFHRLYPQVIDAGLIAALRVQARLMQSAS